MAERGLVPDIEKVDPPDRNYDQKMLNSLPDFLNKWIQGDFGFRFQPALDAREQGKFFAENNTAYDNMNWGTALDPADMPKAKPDFWKNWRRSDNVEYAPNWDNPIANAPEGLKPYMQAYQALQDYKNFKAQRPTGPTPTPAPIPPLRDGDMQVNPYPEINMQKPTSTLPTPAGLPVFPTIGIRG